MYWRTCTVKSRVYMYAIYQTIGVGVVDYFGRVWVTRAQLSRIHTYVQSVPMENRSIITYKTLCEVELQYLCIHLYQVR
jgi:hypothetical protein